MRVSKNGNLPIPIGSYPKAGSLHFLNGLEFHEANRNALILSRTPKKHMLRKIKAIEMLGYVLFFSFYNTAFNLRYIFPYLIEHCAGSCVGLVRIITRYGSNDGSMEGLGSQ